MLDPEIIMRLSPAAIEARKEALGLNDPFHVRYALWLKELASGNLGYSIIRRRPVAELMVEAWRKTILLVVLSMVVSTTVGIALGVLSALRVYSGIDYGLTILSFLGASVPNFFFAMILMYTGAVKLGWFPTSGLQSPVIEGNALLDRAHHLVLPVLAMCIGGWAGMQRFTRSSMLEVLNQDYITMARAKGLSERTVNLRHALKNAMLPLVTILGLSLPRLIGGAFIIETLFNFPGMGSLMVDSTLRRDYPMMMGGLLLAAVMVLVANLVADIAYAVVDPRIRYD
jgi:peptide/nickel transport system permease protein